MDDMVYLNGDWLPLSEAKVSVEDRGFLFADGIYEVLRVYDHKIRALDIHATRLANSLKAVYIDGAEILPQFTDVCEQLISRNNMPDATIYWQVTRGVAPRTHRFPIDIKSTVFAMISPAMSLQEESDLRMHKCITLPDERWLNCHIKSTALLPNVIAAQKASEQGAYDAILHRDGYVTEGSARTVLGVKNGVIHTHPLNGRILPGVTRDIIQMIAEKMAIEFVEEAFSVEDLYAMDEIVLLGTTTAVAGVKQVDETLIGNGSPGQITSELSKAYLKWIKDNQTA